MLRGLLKHWIPSITMLLVSLISYIDRNTLALLSPTILHETGLSVEQYGYIVSAFSVAYMIGNPVWGRILDRYGLPWGMAASVSFWTLASAAHAFASGFWSFAVARAALGFGEGATFPGGLRAAVQSLPVHLRSRGIAISYSGGSLGAVVTPFIVGPVAAHWGWRYAFFYTGLIGAAWLVIWAFVSRRRDMRSMSVSGGTVEVSTARPGWRDPRVWSFMAAYSMGGLPLAFVLYQSAIYLNRVLGEPQTAISRVLWIPPLGWEVGYFFWGWVTDRTLQRSSNRMGAYRGLFGICTLLSFALAVVPHLPHSLYLTLALLFFAMFVAAGFIILSMSYSTFVYSPAHSGLIAGLGAGSWGAMVALVMPVFGRMFDQRQYSSAFFWAALLPLIGYTIWRYINREVKHDEE
ncbi:MAG: MFS transporter [Acidobacteria bacterium]|nr:MFS transporter [Acidobacteriota bacterium]